MKRRLRINWLVWAALVTGAVMAPGAQAQFTSTNTHTILSGTQEGNITITAAEGFGAIKCSTVSTSGTSASTNAADMTLGLALSGCIDLFGRTVDVDAGNPTLTYTRTGTSGGTPVGTAHFSGTLQFTVTSVGFVVCTFTVKPGITLNGITYHSGGGILGAVTFSITNLRGTLKGSFFNCGSSEGEYAEGTVNGSMKITGRDTAGASVSISVS